MIEFVRNTPIEFREYYIQMQAAKRSQAPLPAQVRKHSGCTFTPIEFFESSDLFSCISKFLTSLNISIKLFMLCTQPAFLFLYDYVQGLPVFSSFNGFDLFRLVVHSHLCSYSLLLHVYAQLPSAHEMDGVAIFTTYQNNFYF